MAVAAEIQPTSTSTSRGRRRLFSIGNRRFAFPTRINDAFMAGLVKIVDGCILILGPFLILFASVIITGLTYAFFIVLLPMIQRANPNSTFVVPAHAGFVIFILTNVISNYVLCVTAKHKGPLYDRVVRELADVTNFFYPQTPEEVAQSKRDFEDRMVYRMQRRQARYQQQLHQQNQQQLQLQQQQQQQHNQPITLPPPNIDTVTQRKSASTSADNQLSQQQPLLLNTNQPQPPSSLPLLRKWMIMGPHEWGFCNNSNQPKPPRSHYDHVTKTLVLNMDHYCPWMFNVVGYFNYRYFFNFLLYVFIGMIYGLLITLRPFMAIQSSNYYTQIKKGRATTGQPIHQFDYVPIPSERTAVAFSFMLCASIGIAVLSLLGFHIYLLFTGQTTVEFHGNCANRRRARKQRKKWKNPYDMGWKQNFKQVYGDGNPFLAIIIPSNREPQYLPVPVPGKDGKRPNVQNISHQPVNTV